MSLALALVPGPTSATEPAPPQAGAFSPAGSLGEGRDGHSATLLDDGRVLIIGGGSETARRSVDVWDPATASFEAVVPLLQFQVVADMKTGLNLYRDRCRSPVPATEP